MNKARLGNGRGIIPNTFGKPFYIGNLDVCQLWTLLVLFRGDLICKKRLFKIDSRFTPSYKKLKLII